MLEIEMEEVETAEKAAEGPSFTTSLTKEELEQVLGHLLDQLCRNEAAG